MSERTLKYELNNVLKNKNYLNNAFIHLILCVGD